MTPAQLRRAAEAYGGVNALSRALDLNERTLRRRLTAEWNIPKHTASEIASLLYKRAIALRSEAARCEAIAKELSDE